MLQGKRIIEAKYIQLQRSDLKLTKMQVRYCCPTNKPSHTECAPPPVTHRQEYRTTHQSWVCWSCLKERENRQTGSEQGTSEGNPRHGSQIHYTETVCIEHFFNKCSHSVDDIGHFVEFVTQLYELVPSNANPVESTKCLLGFCL